MEHVSPQGFFYGLAELFFDIFLLWDIAEGNETKERDCKGIPSWSFLGWKGGQLDLLWWRFSMDHTFEGDPSAGFGSDCEVGSIVSWFKQSQDGKTLVPVANQFHICRSQWMDKPPQGWTKHETGAEEYETYYIHESTGDHRFRYPIALPEPKSASGREQFSQYLHFKAKRGWMHIGNAIKPALCNDNDSDDDDNCDDNSDDGGSNYYDGSQNGSEYSDNTITCFSLIDKFGKWAGAIRLPLAESNKSNTLSNSIPSEAPIELIAIATGKVDNGAFPKREHRYAPCWTVPEWHYEKRPKQEMFYEFYFVLCIEWREGIAYRKGLGRVEKKAWERLLLEEIDIVLG